MKLLHIDSSILGDNSASRQLSSEVVKAWQAADPQVEVSYRDLAAEAIEHFSAATLVAAGTPAELRDAAQKHEAQLSADTLAQFLAADAVVIAAPMYNFTIPTQLKAWIDRIAQSGRTFKYTDKGAVGLAGNKTVIVALSRGGMYSTSDAGRSMEHQETYLQTVMGFMGVTDVRFVRAEGVGMGDAAKAQALQAADTEIRALTTPAANQANAVQAA